jgi:hypothetical protein
MRFPSKGNTIEWLNIDEGHLKSTKGKNFRVVDEQGGHLMIYPWLKVKVLPFIDRFIITRNTF